ncbi:MAG TPA: hypothetical protein VK932_08855, partial [Kofleriaceae bacterium]|nr:hypothetical protein [Kofleriaceae bacterium]
MRAAAAAAIARGIAVVAIVLLGAAPAARATPAGFDHNIHLSRVAASGADPIPCARCHTWRAGALAGKPGHRACFDGCHGGVPAAPARG